MAWGNWWKEVKHAQTQGTARPRAASAKRARRKSTAADSSSLSRAESADRPTSRGQLTEEDGKDADVHRRPM